MHDPIPTGPGEHLVPDLALGPHPGPQDVLPPPPVLLQRLDRLLADHAPIGHDADPALPVQHGAYDYLPQVGPVVLAVAPLPQALAPLALEVDAGGVEEDQLQLA